MNTRKFFTLKIGIIFVNALDKVEVFHACGAFFEVLVVEQRQDCRSYRKCAGTLTTLKCACTLTTFFPHATTDKAALRPLPVIEISTTLGDLDSPFTLSELQVVMPQGKPNSAPSHGRIKWQDIRNLPPSRQEALLPLINHSWDTG